MKAFSLLVLLLLAAQVYSQTQPVVYNPFNRTISTTQSGTFLLNQRLPACYQANYLVTDITTINEGDMFTVLYVPKTNGTIPAPSSTVTIEFFYGTANAPVTPIRISSVIDQTVNSIPYLSRSNGCAVNSNIIVARSPGNAGSGCGINYYCSGFTFTQTTRLWVVITTTDAENDQGIIFDLAVQKASVTITQMTLSQTLTTTTTPPVGSAFFKPTVAQRHYKIKVGAAGTSLTQQADYLTLANPNNKFLFTLSNVKVNNVAQTLGTNLGEWSITINTNDLAGANNVGLLNTDPNQPCVVQFADDPAFYTTKTNLTIEYTGCGINAGTYYIAVGLPLNFNTSYTYDLLVTIKPLDNDHYTPTYQVLNQGVYINDNIGYFTTSDTELYNIYLLNIANNTFVNGSSSIYVTVFGINNGDLIVEVTQNCFGFDNNCGACNVLASCDPTLSGSDKDTTNDYCKIKINPCQTNPNLPYFITIRANTLYGDNYYISYSVKYDIITTTVVDITKLRSEQGNGYIDYIYSGSVAEQDYNHFVYKVNSSAVTPLSHLSVNFYVEQAAQQAIVAHNLDKLAGSAPFVYLYDTDGYGRYRNFENPDEPQDNCYSWDWFCNTEYKNRGSPILHFQYDVDEYGACSLVLPYCQLVEAQVGHYFSVKGVNAGPNSYWSTYKGVDEYANGIGYNRSIEYTIIFRLWSAAENLDPIEIDNGFVYSNAELIYSYSNQENLDNYNPDGTDFNDNWYSHQYVFPIPNDGNLYDSIRVVLGDVQTYGSAVSTYLYATCGSAAGDCPCFSAADFSCQARDYNTGYDDNSCEVYIPLCECNSGKIFLSVRSVSSNYNTVPITFNLGVYPQITTKVGTIGVPTTAAQIEDLLSPNLEFNPFSYTVTPGSPESFGPLSGLGTMVFYDTALYSLRLNQIAAQRALEFTVRFTRAPSRLAYTQSIIMSIGENIIPPSNPLAADCSLNCVATTDYNNGESYGYCTIVLDPCQLTLGATYYIRLSSSASTSIGSFNDANAGVGYTLTVANINYAPTALTIGQPLADHVFQDEYSHYSIVVPNNQGSLRVKVYRNWEQEFLPLVVYLNTNGTLAGDTPCYSFTDVCVLAGRNYVTCEFFLPACDLTALAGKTIFLSVHHDNNYFYQEYGYYFGFNFQDYFLVNGGSVPGDNAVYYTVDISYNPLTVLSLTPGATVTGNLFNFESAYYSYTVAAADITAGKVLHVELKSIEPISAYDDVVQFRTTFTTTNPATQNGCPCSDKYYTNSFSVITDSCTLTAGTYYFSVKALVNGFDAARDPISYTIKAFWVVPITQSLALSTVFTAAPKPLNFNDRVLYSIPVTLNRNAVIEVEIADLTYQADSLYAYGLKAFLNFGTPASETCYDQFCDFYNGVGVQPNGTVMCRLTTTPCTQCSGTYYLTVVGDFLAPEPRIQYRSNYTVRAYSRTIGTLDGFTTSGATYRTNATQATGYTFTIANTANPVVSCDDRWGTTVYFDYFYQLPALTVNLYETLDITSSGSNSASYDIAFGNGVSTSRQGCGCDVAPGATCNFVSGCQTVTTTTVTPFGRVGVASCSLSSSNLTVNGIAFNTQIKTDRVYTALAPLRATVNTQLNVTNLRAGQYVTIQFQPTNINFNLLPTLTYTLDLFGASGTLADRTCYTTGIGSAVVPTIFPGSTTAGSSYCAATTCSPLSASPVTFDGCCVDANQNTFITVYNPLNSGVAAFNFTFLAATKNLVNDYSSLNLPLTQSYTVVRNDLTSSFSFTLSPSQVSFDDVVYIRITAGNGTVTAYFNALSYSRSSGACTGTDFSCTTGTNCVLQLPACFFNTLTAGGYATYYVSLEATSAPIVGPVSVSITPQRTTVIPFPSSGVSGSVPDQASTPVDYLNNYKFAYTRSVGDQGLSDNKVALKVVLTPATNANNTLLLSLTTPGSTSGNPLAGPPLTNNPASGSCDYNNDATWQCFASNNTNGAQTRQTQGSLGVTCFLYYCNNGVAESKLAQLLAGQFIYLSVQNTESIGRVVTSFSIAVSVQSLTLPNTEVVYSVTPSRSNTDGNLTTTVCSTTAFTGGCQYRASVNVTTAYFNVNLANIATWGINDYLLVNFTQLTSTIGINYWYNDECEPASGATVQTCNVGDNCIIQYDPCDFTWFYRADNGANQYVVEARNIYFRITGLTSASNFSVAFQQVTPLQITVPLTIASPKYQQTFQSWEGRWTMFNFVLPKNHLYDFTLSITSDCGASSAPEIYTNEYVSQWASKHCSEIEGDTLPFSATHYSCELGGNYFASVYTPIGSLEFDPISIPEGLVSPQIKFTVVAQLVNVAKYTNYAWETEVTLNTPSTLNSYYNYLAIGDNENYGTTITIAHYANNNGAGTTNLVVVSPLFRETYINDAYATTEEVPIGAWNTAFFTGENSFCDSLVAYCSSENRPAGIYCCFDDNDCVINIPPCDYRNGRHYIYAQNNVASTLTSRIYRQDYIPVTLDASSNFIYSGFGTLPVGLIEASNRNINYYQFYEINLSVNAYFLHVSLYTTVADFYAADVTSRSINPLLRGSLKRGDTGVSTSSDNGSSGCQTGDCSSCSTVYCSTNTPGICNFGDVTCPASTYFLGVWFQYHDNGALVECDVLNYNLYISAQDDASITILPNTQVCGTLQTQTASFSNPKQVPDTTYGNDGYNRFTEFSTSELFSFDRRAEGDLYNDNNGPFFFDTYPDSVNYKVDLTNINTATAEFEVVLTVFPTHVSQDVKLSLSTNRPASSVCNGCSDTTDVDNGDVEARVSIACGAFTELWINVASVSRLNTLEAYDYTLIVNTVQYTPVAVTIPSLTFGVPASIPVTIKGNSVVNVTTNNHLVALIAPTVGGSLTKVTGPSKYTAQSCADGCTAVNTGCTYLASQSGYNLFYQASFSTAVECFETAVTQSTTSFSVQSVHSVTLPSSGFTNITASVPAGGVDLFYVPLPVFGVTTDNIVITTQLELQSGIVVTGSCTGFPLGTGCSNAALFTYDSEANGVTLSVENQLCGCSALYIAVYQDEDACGLASTSFTLSFQVNADALPSAAVALTSSAYVADTLPTFSVPNNYNLYTIVAGADGFIHSSINQANNTAGPNFHDLQATLYNSQYCVIDSCFTGIYTTQDTPPNRDDNSQDRSCFVYTDSAVPGATYYLTVAPDEAIVDPTATYRLNAITAFTDLETTASSRFQLIGSDRHYYKVAGRAGGVATGALQSVVVTLNLIDGDRVVVAIADSPKFIDTFVNGNAYSGWSRTKTCYYGDCTLEISTRALHPGNAIFYVWVLTVSPTTEDGDERIEKFTNYQISATTGTNNCKASSTVTGFCASTVSTLSNVFGYRNVTLRNAEAQSRFNSFLCRCNPPSSTCVASLTRFSCLESFRECDSGGFWTPVCRSECEQTVASCGAFEESDGSCSCTRPEFTCTNARYSDAASAGCTGATLPSPTPSRAPASPSRNPSGVSSSPLASGASQSRSASRAGGQSASNSPAPVRSASRTPTPNGGNGETIIKYYFIYETSDASSFSMANSFLVVFASALFSLFFF